jgi:3-methyladenine DNA glycosylase AlkD
VTSPPDRSTALGRAVDQVETALLSAADPVRAEGESAYLKSAAADADRIHLGVSVPACRAILRSAVKPLEPLSREELLPIVERWWDSDLFEYKRVATELAVRNQAAFAVEDMSLIEAWLRTARTWALIDEWAPRVVGPLAERDRSAERVVDRWAVDDDFWIRRCALLSLLLGFREGRGDWERFTRYAEPLLADTEFFVRKAIGWVLREAGSSPRASEQDQADTIAWIEPRAVEMSGLTFRESTRKLPDPVREHLHRVRTLG